VVPQPKPSVRVFGDGHQNARCESAFMDHSFANSLEFIEAGSHTRRALALEVYAFATCDLGTSAANSATSIVLGDPFRYADKVVYILLSTHISRLSTQRVRGRTHRRESAPAQEALKVAVTQVSLVPSFGPSSGSRRSRC
jgi:hypothetical protein